MDRLLEILAELRPDVNFEEEKALVTDGILDSVDIIALVAELSDEYDIRIKPAHLIPENFDSVDAMLNLINTLEEE